MGFYNANRSPPFALNHRRFQIGGLCGLHPCTGYRAIKSPMIKIDYVHTYITLF